MGRSTVAKKCQLCGGSEKGHVKGHYEGLPGSGAVVQPHKFKPETEDESAG